MLRQARSGLVSVFQHPVVKLSALFVLWSSIRLLFAAHSTRHSPLDVLALYPHCTCWQLKSSAYTYGGRNTGKEGIGMEFVDTDNHEAINVQAQFDFRIFRRPPG